MAYRKLGAIFVATLSSVLFAYYSIVFLILYNNQSDYTLDFYNVIPLAVQSLESCCVFAVVLVISWVVSNHIYWFISSERESVKNRAILITGCDSGFGLQLAKKCDKLGYHVFAGVLMPDQDGALELKSMCSERVKVIKMDVTKLDDVNNVIDVIKQSKPKLWAVVNNAGIAVSAPIEWGYDCNEVEKTFAVNVFGAVRVTKLCLPLLRETKGRVVNVCSIAGRITSVNITAYSMAKHALRSFSDGLRREVYRFGIKVVTIEPYFYRTPIVNSISHSHIIENIWKQTPNDVQRAYGKSGYQMVLKHSLLASKASRRAVHEVIDAMVDAISIKDPKLYYRCSGLIDSLFLWFVCNSPEYVQDLLIFLTSDSSVINLIIRLYDWIDSFY